MAILKAERFFTLNRLKTAEKVEATVIRFKHSLPMVSVQAETQARFTMGGLTVDALKSISISSKGKSCQKFLYHYGK